MNGGEIILESLASNCVEIVVGIYKNIDTILKVMLIRKMFDCMLFSWWVQISKAQIAKDVYKKFE
jgi:hypothetical protein